MTPTMEAPAVDTSGADFDAALDDFQGLVNSAGEEQPVEQAAEELPGGEAPTPPPDGGQPEQAPPGEGPTSEYQLSEDGSHYLVPKDQLGVFQTNQEFLQKAQEMFPTLADAQAARTESSWFNQMRQDILGDNGDEGYQRMFDYFTGKHTDANHPETKAAFERGFVQMAERLPGVLEGMAPEAHAKVWASINQPYVNGLYDQAAQTGDPAILKAAQVLDWYVNNKWEKEPPKVDPNAAAIQAQAQRDQQISSREKVIRDHEWGQYNQKYLAGAKTTEFNAELDRALAPFKEKYDPETFADIRDGVQRRLIAKLGEDKLWANDHSNQYKRIQKGFEQDWKPGKQINQQAAAYWKNDFMTRVRRYLPSIAEGRLKGTPQTKSAAPRTAKTAPTPARTNAPGRAANGQFTREQQEAAFDAGVNDLAKSFGW